ncbi:hypothetical protein CEUSTIGMA_g8914.t1 [Chlamydomonas eustigma]|uniref:Uncharacterized protein n=1 Tax=Chlamydomonas eustigma TaxID=1157962 RepID=A0A250XEH8_9CHLO|nr:hypothetical protein CEUSTIGMA_g8914.t1 [Chlamydomonas eustigma]|eukprot:GAX81485.1 hypothetical protein CEUSTIGMA_g8914.t1 [Chlamydomonas eustigma]
MLNVRGIKSASDTCRITSGSPCFCNFRSHAIFARKYVRVFAAYQPIGTAVAGAPAQSADGSALLAPPPVAPNPIYATIETAIQRTFNSQLPGHRNDWREIEGSYVLFPPSNRPPEAVVHFLGGAFVGAAPQVAYRLFLEAISNRNVLIIATPYGTNLDHLRSADECQFKFDRAVRALGPEFALLPTFGLGHSLGSVIQLLICSRYAVARAGNVFVSFNNRSANDVIPLMAPLIAPSARLLGPVLNQISSSPVRSTVESVLETLRGLSPGAVRSVIPLVEQFMPLYLDMAQGRQEFAPAPEETKSLIRSYYAVPRNLILRFKDDTIDESNSLAQLLQSSSSLAEVLDLSVRTLPGDHLRLMQQAVVDLPPEVARVASSAVNTSGELIGRMAAAANQMGVPQATDLLNQTSKGVTNIAGVFGGQVGGPVTDYMQSLADEVAAWMGTGAVVRSGTRALPASSVYSQQNGQYREQAW